MIPKGVSTNLAIGSGILTGKTKYKIKDTNKTYSKGELKYFILYIFKKNKT
jgi:hypothetical protein